MENYNQLIQSLKKTSINEYPYKWAFINNLFTAQQLNSLSLSFPNDDENFKNVNGYDGEKGFIYKVRPLVHINNTEPYCSENLSEEWKNLSKVLISKEYRDVISNLTNINLSDSDIEINAFHYTPGSWMGPHLDIKEKIVTHVLYFNEEWDLQDGGNFSVLRSNDMSDAIVSITPIVGNSVLLVRSKTSWHAVTKVQESCVRIRKNIIVNFYPKGTETIMWKK